MFDDLGGVVVELDEGLRIARALGANMAAILQNHGLLTVGETVDAAIWWYVAMENCCKVQLLVEAAKGNANLQTIADSIAKQTHSLIICWMVSVPTILCKDKKIRARLSSMKYSTPVEMKVVLIVLKVIHCAQIVGIHIYVDIIKIVIEVKYYMNVISIIPLPAEPARQSCKCNSK